MAVSRMSLQSEKGPKAIRKSNEQRSDCGYIHNVINFLVLERVFEFLLQTDAEHRRSWCNFGVNSKRSQLCLRRVSFASENPTHSIILFLVLSQSN